MFRGMSRCCASRHTDCGALLANLQFSRRSLPTLLILSAAEKRSSDLGVANVPLFVSIFIGLSSDDN